ncbi:MAG: T9SS type A sorting domain-containing protein [Ferruginibacter sp.]
MNRKILLSAALISTTLLATAQQSGKTYAITGKQNNKFFWADIKEVDIATGKVVKTLFDADKTAFKSVNFDTPKGMQYQQEGSPTAYGVAACAFDARFNRLYFAPMHFSEIRYLDLAKEGANFVTVKRNVIQAPANGYQSEENHITRMVIAADGFGYAITNDANHLIRFTTGKKTQVEDLGNIIDAESNKGLSIHNKCSSWGGDMVADAFGKLIIVSANHNVFSVDVHSRIATFTGTISGLPPAYTTNGAVVDQEGNLVVSSANVFDGLYRVNIKDLKAVKIESNETPFNASDLANGNFLSQKEKDALTKFDLVKPTPVAVGGSSVYPNPVTGNQFNVLFDNLKLGRYTILLTDLAGRVLQSKVATIVSPKQIENVRLFNKVSKGMYLVKVLDEKGQLSFSDKVVIE